MYEFFSLLAYVFVMISIGILLLTIAYRLNKYGKIQELESKYKPQRLDVQEIAQELYRIQEDRIRTEIKDGTIKE